jgi:hypothetical protein
MTGLLSLCRIAAASSRYNNQRKADRVKPNKARIFDLDLWRACRPGRDEQFDADLFGVWIEVLVESGCWPERLRC